MEKSTQKPHGIKLRSTMVNGRSTLLPDDPIEAAKTLIARKTAKSPAQRARDHMMASMKKRGLLV
jgi:hypothetical protein